MKFHHSSVALAWLLVATAAVAQTAPSAAVGNVSLPGNATVRASDAGNATIPDNSIVLPAGAKASYVEPTLTGAEADWHELGVMLRQPRAGDSAGKNGEDLVHAADKFKAFADKYPNDIRASDAKCYEGIMLLRAQLSGDTGNRGRLQSALARSLHDTLATPTVRAELFGLNDSADILGKGGTPKAILASFEKASRKLIAEFPDLPNGYEGLGSVANDSDDEEGLALATELAAMTAAPTHIRDAARTIASRFMLRGKSVGDLVKNVPGASALTGAPKQATYVYAWSSAFVGSVRRAQALAAKVGSESNLIGVCLDQDVAAARKFAATANPPGTLVYDAAGQNGPLASALKLNAPGLMYELDANGVVVSTATHIRLGPKNVATQ